jgi:hypothetical protein
VIFARVVGALCWFTGFALGVVRAREVLPAAVAASGSAWTRLRRAASRRFALAAIAVVIGVVLLFVGGTAGDVLVDLTFMPPFMWALFLVAAGVGASRWARSSEYLWMGIVLAMGAAVSFGAMIGGL